MILTTLWVAGTVDTALGFGDPVYSFNSSTFPSMQMVLVMAFGVGPIFCLVMPSEVLLHLDLGWLPSIWRCCFTIPVLNLWVAGKACIISGLCRNKFKINFRVAMGRTKNRSLSLQLFRGDILGLGPISIGYGPFYLAINCYWETALKIAPKNGL